LARSCEVTLQSVDAGHKEVVGMRWNIRTMSVRTAAHSLTHPEELLTAICAAIHASDHCTVHNNVMTHMNQLNVFHNKTKTTVNARSGK